jgi:ribose 5-phosphate isomerase B
MKVAIANDHAGTKYKFSIVEYLKKKGIDVINFGTDDENSMDYPDVIHPAASAIEKGEADLGIILCGSGNGAAITANHHQNIRAALCWNKELCALARQHNDANILSIPARYVSEKEALEMVEVFINTTFEGGRHLQRIKKIPVSY